jgi:hypothetical protein
MTSWVFSRGEPTNIYLSQVVDSKLSGREQHVLGRCLRHCPGNRSAVLLQKPEPRTSCVDRFASTYFYIPLHSHHTSRWTDKVLGQE